MRICARGPPLAHARAIESEFNSLVDRIFGLQPTRTLRLGVLSTILVRLIAGLVQRNRGADASQPMELIEGTERDLVARLQWNPASPARSDAPARA